jgi:hypothetical protein
LASAPAVIDVAAASRHATPTSVDLKLPLFIAQKARLKPAEGQVVEWLDRHFDETISAISLRAQSSPNASDTLTSLFSTYARIGATHHVERRMMGLYSPSAAVVDSSSPNAAHLSFPDPSKRKGWEALSHFREWVRRHIYPLIPLASDSLEYRIVLRCVWKSLSDSPMMTANHASASALFVSTDAELLHRNYRCLKSFQTELLGLCRSAVEQSELCSDASWLEVNRKWNWAVYIQLRSLEILGEPHQLLSHPEVIPASPSSELFHSKQALITQSLLLSRLFNPDPVTGGVFVAPLAHRCLKIALQLLARYHQFSAGLCERLSPRLLESWDSFFHLAADTINMSTLLLKTDSSGQFSLFNRLRTDAESSVSFPAIEPVLNEAILASARRLRSLFESNCNDVVSQGIFSLCMHHQSGPVGSGASQSSVLAAGVRALSSQYLLSSEKGMPTSPSTYVRTVFENLRLLMGSDAGRRVESQVWSSWLSLSMGKILSHYHETIVQFAQSTSKRQEFLNRQKRGQPSASSPALAVTAGAKMAEQIRIDVEELCAQIESFVGVGGLPGQAKEVLLEFVRTTVPTMLADVN